MDLILIPALVTLPKRWSELSNDAKWNVLSLVLIFIFFTASGSRRSYYVLPVVPFAVLVTADWLSGLSVHALRQRLAALCVLVSAILILAMLDIAPAWYYSRCGVERFATHLKHEAEKQRPWSAWHVVMLDAETKLSFYLNLPPNVQNFDVAGSVTVKPVIPESTLANFKKSWFQYNYYQSGTVCADTGSSISVLH